MVPACYEVVPMNDLVMMQMNQRRFCVDVRVMRGANCWTDH